MSTKELEEVYDESCYPGPAGEYEEDWEMVSAEQTSLPMDDGLPPHDVTCSVCSDIMIDPVSLHCGHTFCQLCLARVWRSSGKLPPSRLTCPVCRLPWRNFPGVNITLRNIIEKTYSKLIEKRRKLDISEDDQLSKAFASAKETSWRQERVEGQRAAINQRDARLIVILCVSVLVLVGVVIMLMVMGGAFWVWSGASGEYMRKPVSHWSNSDVVSWVEGLGQWAQTNLTQVFVNEAITGTQLLKLDKSALSSFGILSEFRQETILDAIEELRLNDFTVPRNLQEFMAAHRKQTFILAILYKFWPRFAFFYVYIFSYDTVFLPLLIYQDFDESQLTEFMMDSDVTGPNSDPGWIMLFLCFCEIIFVPNFVILRFAWSWWSHHPWICSAVMLHCFVSMYREGTLATLALCNPQTWKYATLRALLRRLGNNLLVMILALILVSILWPVMPHFICDIIFYSIVWHSTLKIILVNLKKFGNVRANVNIRL